MSLPDYIAKILASENIETTVENELHHPLPIYEFTDPTGGLLRSAPNTNLTSDIVIGPNTLVERLDNVLYADQASTAISFFLVRVSADLKVTGFLPAQQVITIPTTETIYFLLKTPRAVAAQCFERKICHKDKKKSHHCPCHKKGKSKKKEIVKKKEGIVLNTARGVFPLLELIGVTPVNLLTIPNSVSGTVIHSIAPGAIVERLTPDTYPDQAGSTGITYIFIRLSKRPLVQGFAPVLTNGNQNFTSTLDSRLLECTLDKVCGYKLETFQTNTLDGITIVAVEDISSYINSDSEDPIVIVV